MAIANEEKILKAISDLKNDLTERFDLAIKSLKDMTSKDIQHIESDIWTLKQQSAEHFAEEKNLLGKFADSIVAHAQEDARHIEEVDMKIDRIGGRMTSIEQKIATQEGQATGKKSTGSSINTWVAFAFMFVFGMFNLYQMTQGVTP